MKIILFFLFVVNTYSQSIQIQIGEIPPSQLSLLKWKLSRIPNPSQPQTCDNATLLGYIGGGTSYPVWLSNENYSVSNPNVALCNFNNQFVTTQFWNFFIYNNFNYSATLQPGTYPSINLTNLNSSLQLIGNTYYYNPNGGPSGLSAATLFIRFTNSLSNVDFEDEELFTIFPNPTKDFFHINTEKLFVGTIYDVFGKLLINVNTNDVDISSLSAGIYFLKITCEGKSYIKKIIKE